MVGETSNSEKEISSIIAKRISSTETNLSQTTLENANNKTDNSETKIQNGDQKEEARESNSNTNAADARPFLQRHAFLVTLMLNTMADGLGWAVRGQFMYRFFHSQFDERLDKFNGSAASACGSGQDADPEVLAIENEISQTVARWGLYEQYVIIVPLICASLVLGMKSDHIGRRFIFLFPLLSTVIDCVILACVIRFGWHYKYTLIGAFTLALSGGNISMAFAAYALISDTHGKKGGTEEHRQGSDNTTEKITAKKSTETNTTSPKVVTNTEGETDLDMSRENSRAFKIVLLDVSRFLSISAISFATGYIIQYAGFFYTALVVIGVKVVLFLFAFVFVTETGQQKMSTGFVAPLRSILRATKNPRKRLTLVLVNLGLMFCVFSFVNELQVLRTYQMSPPFCFGAVQLGWFASENRLKGVFAIPLLLLWRRLGMIESTIAGVGLFFNAASNLMLAVVRETWVFYAMPAIAIPGDLSLSMSKVITSRMIGRQALASTFAVMLAGEELFAFAGSIASSYLYQYSLATVPTAPFYLASASFLLSACLFFVETWNQRTYRAVDPDVEVRIEPDKMAASTITVTKL